jgi:hypothetical protein
MEKKPIIHKAKSLSVSVWNNVSNEGTVDESKYKSFKIQRAYKDRETGSFKYTDQLREEDLPLLASLLQVVFQKETVKRFE